MITIAGSQAAKAVAGLGMVGMLVQTSPVLTPDIGAIAEVSRLGTTGLLAVAVIVLWRKLQEKDGLLMANYRSMAESLAANKATSEKMAETLEAIKEEVQRLATVREQLGR